MKTDYGNIKLVEEVNHSNLRTLKENEYFVLMVTDKENRCNRAKSDYCDFENGFVGIECNSNKKRYISKNFFNRKDLFRGKTFICTVEKPELEIELDF